MKIQFKIILIILFCFSFLLASCSKSENTQENNIDYSFLTATEGSISIPLTPFDNLNPLTTDNISYLYFSELMFEGLYKLKNNYKPEEILVSNITEEGKKITVSIIDGVQFHDGSYLTSQDIVNSLEMIRNTGKGAYYNLMVNNITKKFPLEAKVIDRNTVEFNFTGEGPFLKEYLIFPIVKKDENGNYIGTGPYKLSNLEKNREVLLERFVGYHGEKSAIERIKGIILEDEQLIYTAIDTGRIQATISFSDEFLRFSNNENFHGYRFASNKVYGLFINNRNFSNDFKNLIRKSINKERIKSDIFNEYATVANTFLNPDSYINRPFSSSYNLEESKLLSNKIENKKIRLYYYSGNEIHKLIAAKLIQFWNNVGIDVIDVSRNESFESYSQNLKSNFYDVCIFALNTNIIKDQTYDLINGNIFNYSNDDLKSLHLELSKKDNIEQAMDVIQEIDNNLIKNSDFIPLVFSDSCLILSKNIVGEFHPNLIFPYDDLKTAYFTSP